MNYYNEIDPFAAEWLRNLIAYGNALDAQAAQVWIETLMECLP